VTGGGIPRADFARAAEKEQRIDEDAPIEVP
jgi:hypothetical protein